MIVRLDTAARDDIREAPNGNLLAIRKRQRGS